MSKPFLDNDIARCIGMRILPCQYHPQCSDCLRRTAHNDNYSVFMNAPTGEWNDGACPYRIAP
jgi:hypothetical protein